MSILLEKNFNLLMSPIALHFKTNMKTCFNNIIGAEKNTKSNFHFIPRKMLLNGDTHYFYTGVGTLVPFSPFIGNTGQFQSLDHEMNKRGDSTDNKHDLNYGSEWFSSSGVGAGIGAGSPQEKRAMLFNHQHVWASPLMESQSCLPSMIFITANRNLRTFLN